MRPPLLLLLTLTLFLTTPPTAAAASSTVTPTYSPGDSSLTAECSSTSQCAPGEWCIGIHITDYGALLRTCSPNFSSPTCICGNPPPICLDSSACSVGYRCVRSPFLDNRRTCLHCNYIAVAKTNFELVDTQPRCTPSASPIPTNTAWQQLPVTGGYTWDPCENDSNCVETRQCLRYRSFPLDDNQPCDQDNPEHDSCVCRPPEWDNGCETSQDCLEGDRCVNFVAGPVSSHRLVCASCSYLTRSMDVVAIDGGSRCGFTPRSNAIPSNSPAMSPSPIPSSAVSSSPVLSPAASTSLPPDNVNNGVVSTSPQQPSETTTTPSNDPDEAVCIHADLLTHLSSSQLVFRQHRRTHVLCDRFGSCATAGHIVVHDGQPMMMRTYCAAIPVAKCSWRRNVPVNSPKMRRGLRVASRTPGLLFTALSARWTSALEERVLRTAVRYGW